MSILNDPDGSATSLVYARPPCWYSWRQGVEKY